MNKIKDQLAKRSSDSRFFTATKRGEGHELREELNSGDVLKEKNAIKKVIANMTMGRDVSSLYPDVVKLSRTSNMELKKLVYLYLMNNSKLAQDKAILAVNTFVQDCQHENAVVRALALRTMLCICVDEVLEYTTEPLRKGMQDADPYVRKTAALGVLKLYASKPKFVEDHGFIGQVQNLLMDPSPMVVSNTIISLNEINTLSKANAELGLSVVNIELTFELFNKLLNALPECTEWGQIVILDFIAQHYCIAGDVELLLDRIVPRLAHLNHAIVLSSIKTMIKFLEFVTDDVRAAYYRKLAPPIVSLLNAAPEVQYVTLRNVMVIIQKYPTLLAKDVKTFFCKYTDPPYVKAEKLVVLLTLLDSKNVGTILTELKEYCTEIDVEFVRQAVRTLGGCAFKIESAAERCIEIILEVLRTKSEFAVNDCIVAVTDILRRYPGRFEGVIAVLCEHLEHLDTVEAKQSLVWVIGEYSHKIENAAELLQMFIDTFTEEATVVKVQILTATVKLFLRFPTQTEGLLTSMLQLCTTASDHPDLRDRAYMYWRLLSNDGMVGNLRDIVLGDKPSPTPSDATLPSALLDELLGDLNTLASTYHRMPNSFSRSTAVQPEEEDEEDEEDDGDVVPLPVDVAGTGADPTAAPAPVAPVAPQPQPVVQPTTITPLAAPPGVIMPVAAPPVAPAPAPVPPPVDPLDEIFASFSSMPPAAAGGAGGASPNSVDALFGGSAP